MNKRGGPSTTAKLKAKPGKYRGLDGKIFEIDVNGRRVEPKEAEESPLPQEQQGHGDQQQQQQEEQEQESEEDVEMEDEQEQPATSKQSEGRHQGTVCETSVCTSVFNRSQLGENNLPGPSAPSAQL